MNKHQILLLLFVFIKFKEQPIDKFRYILKNNIINFLF